MPLRQEDVLVPFLLHYPYGRSVSWDTAGMDIGAGQPAMQSSTSPSFGKRLAWVEPRGTRKADLKGSWESVRVMTGLTAAATAVFLLIANWCDLGAEATWKLLMTAGAIVILCLVALGCARLMQISVKITDKAIIWELGDTWTVYRFGTIDHCEIRTASVGGRTMSLLVVALKNGDRETFGVAPSVSAEILRSTLEQRGVKVVTMAATMSEQVLAGERDDT